MTESMASINAGRQSQNQAAIPTTSPGVRAAIAFILLTCSLAVFLLGANYSTLFPTNGSLLYTGIVTGAFLVSAIVLKRNRMYAGYWQIAYAFFAASAVNFISALFAGYNTDFVQIFATRRGTNQELGLAKLYEALLAVIPIILLIKLSGAGLGSLLLKKGNLSYKWGIGIGALVLVNYLTSVLIFFGTEYSLSQLGPVILWGLVFSFSNSLFEELWVRGLFLKRLVPLVGAVGAVLVSSIWFGALHFLNVAYLPAAVVPIMVANTVTLGIACAVLMLKTDSIWGAVLVHAAADLFLFIAMLAVH